MQSLMVELPSVRRVRKDPRSARKELDRRPYPRAPLWSEAATAGESYQGSRIDKHLSVGQDQWSAVDEYVSGLLAPHDLALKAALETSEKARLPEIQVSPSQGMLLNLLAKALGAGAILEFGTLGGYSTIWLARALTEGGRLVTLEADATYAKVAQTVVQRPETDRCLRIAHRAIRS
jgi:O-methyltransferase